ncbi:MAG: 4Fe-4S binding protein [Thermovenabulum sp.]
MVRNWYPIIDKDKCTQCLSCVNFCKHIYFSFIPFPMRKKWFR